MDLETESKLEEEVLLVCQERLQAIEAEMETMKRSGKSTKGVINLDELHPELITRKEAALATRTDARAELRAVRKRLLRDWKEEEEVSDSLGRIEWASWTGRPVK